MAGDVVADAPAGELLEDQLGDVAPAVVAHVDDQPGAGHLGGPTQGVR